MESATKSALAFHIPHQPFGENEVHHSISHHWFLYHLEKKVIISAFQEPLGLPMSCCAVPPTDIRVIEVPHEDQGLRTRGCLYLSIEGLICLVFLIR